MSEKVYMFPEGGNSTLDPNLMMALNNNGGFGGNVYCRDLGSSNGTMVNQQKVYQEIRIESGDILRIGRLSFFVQVLGDSYE